MKDSKKLKMLFNRKGREQPVRIIEIDEAVYRVIEPGEEPPDELFRFVRCRDCEHEYLTQDEDEPECPDCGSGSYRVLCLLEKYEEEVES